MKHKLIYIPALLLSTAFIGIAKPIQKADAAQVKHLISDFEVTENSFQSVSGGAVNFFRIKIKMTYLQAQTYNFSLIQPAVFALNHNPSKDPFTITIGNDPDAGFRLTYNYSLPALYLLGFSMLAEPAALDDMTYYNPMLHFLDAYRDDGGTSQYYYYATIIIPYNLTTPPGGWQDAQLGTYFFNEPTYEGFSLTDFLEATDQAYNEGERDGFKDGEEYGYSSGYNSGVIDGGSDGYNIGYNSGYNSGLIANEGEAWNEGFKEGSTNSFLAGMEKWIVPAIIIVLIGGGVVSFLMAKKKES